MTNRSIARIRSPRRARQWAITSATGSLIAVTEAAKIFFDLQSGLETDLGFNLNNTTAGAIRLRLTVEFQATAVVGDRAHGDWGIGWFQDDAIAAGVVSLPNPTNDSFDWMAHGHFDVIADAAAVKSIPRNAQQMIVNDSMRKQRENHSTLGMVVSASVLEDPVNVNLGGRVLFLLP